MTSRERVLAATRGAQVDSRPSVAWMTQELSADALVVEELDCLQRDQDGKVLLVDVPNPFGLALKRGIDINIALKDDPSVGSQVLDGLVEEVRSRITISLKNGADGIFYRLHGACPAHCSPMQYGGHYLERDRELLSVASDAYLNVLFIAGEEELYIDFVSDLPATVFAWDGDRSGITAAEVRASRVGPSASSDPASEFSLVIGAENYLQNLEQPTIG